MKMEGQTPRCGSCGRLMETFSNDGLVIVYECCGRKKALPKKEHTFTSQYV